MNTTDRTIFVLAGTNGVGKSSIKDDLIPDAVPYINADFIVRGLNREQQRASVVLAQLAEEYGSEQIRNYISKGQTFSFENNMHEERSYQWLVKQQ